jgi:hypothetical protein
MLEPQKREKESYNTQPRDHEQEAQKAVEQLREQGHHVQKDGDCAGDCPLCEPYMATPGAEHAWLMGVLKERHKLTLAVQPTYVVNRARLQALACHPLVQVTRAKTDPKVIVEVSLTTQVEGQEVTGTVRGLTALP